MNQTMELRNDYGNPDIGTCWERLVGGNHLRLFRQNGPNVHTNALFLAYVNKSNAPFFEADFGPSVWDSVSAEEVKRIFYIYFSCKRFLTASAPNVSECF